MSDDFGILSADRDELVKRRAYQIWEQGGRRDGADQENWMQAAREIDEEMAEVADAAAAPVTEVGAASTPDFSEDQETRGKGLDSPAGAVPGAARLGARGRHSP